MADTTLLCWENPDVSELNLIKIVKFFGGTINLTKLTGGMAGHPEHLERLVPACERLITSARTLAKLGGESQHDTRWQPLLTALAPNVLVYGFEPTPSHGQVLRTLTSEAIAGVEAIESAGRKINVAADFRAACRQFSGVSFDAVGPDKQLTFVAGKGQGVWSPIISLDQTPFFVRMDVRVCRLLLLACQQMPDLDSPVPAARSILQFFPALVPVVMFLHASSKDEFWHNDKPGACFILDDPLLKRRYGFLNYQKLLELMDRKRFSTSIAFIPWNYRKSHPRVAKLLANRPRAYSLCIHGCDHTRAEFGATQQVVLQEKAQQALERMQLHRELSGVDFDDVMVFPQGIFSTVALQALKSCGYLAAVNSTPYPVEVSQDLTLRDLLQVAVTRFSNFPLFTRRYPQKLAELAFDLFLGKPALVVEHHGFFRNGYEALAATVERLYGMDPQLQWDNLGAICSRACLKKVASDGEIQILFFTNRFSLRNETDQRQNYCLLRHTIPDEGEASITVSGRQVDTFQDADGLKFQLSLNPGQAAEVCIALGRSEPRNPSRRLDRVYQAKVFLRRNLSEFRDNYLDMNPLLSKAVRNHRG